jgi:hypothetical protein
MKRLIFILMFFNTVSLNGQSPYRRTNDEFLKVMDQIPIKAGQGLDFFEYAVKLYETDSLQKAGQIFDRIYWLDTSSILGRKSLKLRNEIEQKVNRLVWVQLNNAWDWSWSGTNWGPTDRRYISWVTKRIEIDYHGIKFYRNDTLSRETKYILTNTFDWMFGTVTSHMLFLDNNERWYISFRTYKGFVSNSFWIEQKTKYVCGNYGEGYKLREKPSEITKNSR